MYISSNISCVLIGTCVLAHEGTDIYIIWIRRRRQRLRFFPPTNNARPPMLNSPPLQAVDKAL